MATASRRRGEELESAILRAAWDELMEVGYPGFTLDGVAARANTSRPVLARRWQNRAGLAMAAIRAYVVDVPVAVPDTGNLRDDLLTHLTVAQSRMREVLGVVSFMLAVHFRDPAGEQDARLPAETWAETFAQMQERLLSSGPTVTEQLLDRAAGRGEIAARAVTPAVARLPGILLRHDMIMNMAAVSDARILEIVDEIVLPLLRGRSAP